MASEAIFGFVGVLLGSASTAVLTVYREQLVSRRTLEARQHQHEQSQMDRRQAFQRESVLALQDAVSDVVRAVYDEQDKMLVRMAETGTWPARQWETPTATGWSDAQLRLQAFRARIFDEAVRDIAYQIRSVARDSVWAESLDKAKQSNVRLEQLHRQFNDMVTDALRDTA
jgi:hypothetical protein